MHHTLSLLSLDPSQSALLLQRSRPLYPSCRFLHIENASRLLLVMQPLLLNKGGSLRKLRAAGLDWDLDKDRFVFSQIASWDRDRECVFLSRFGCLSL